MTITASLSSVNLSSEYINLKMVLGNINDISFLLLVELEE